MRCEIPHRCVRRKYRIRRHSPFRLRNCWEGRSVRASSLLRQLAKGGCAARRLSWVTPGFSQSRRCKTTASEFFYAPCSGALSAAGVVVTRSVTATLASALAPAPFAFFPSFLATFAGFPRQALNRGLPLGFRFSALRHLDPKKLD